jgi:hypothetical protein
MIDPAWRPRLGELAFAELERLGQLDRSVRLTDEALAARLVAAGYEAHAPALAFEQTWGGLTFAGFTVGPGACAASGEHGGRDDLVPVVLSDNDVYYFVARDGTGWAQDGIEDPEAVVCASDGDRLLAQIILYHLAWDRRMSDLALDFDDARGVSLAATLNLAPIHEASDERTRVWGDADALVFERAVHPTAPVTTMVAVAFKPLLDRVR